MSSDLKIVLFEPWHLFEIENVNPDGALVDSYMQEPKFLEALPWLKGNSYTAWINGKPQASAGMIDMGGGIGKPWVYFGRLELGNLLRICKLVKLIMSDVAETLSLTRLEIRLLKDFKQGVKFAKLLGFIVEDDKQPDFYFMVKVMA